MNNIKEIVARYINDHCIERPEPGTFFLGKMAGTRYSSQYYLSRLLYNTELMSMISMEFIKIVEKEIGHWNFQLCGREWSAIPLLISLSTNLRNEGHDINAFMIRRKRKTYGTHTFIEGKPNDLPVLIVDDLCNSTDSFRHCAKVCELYEIEVMPVIFAIMNKYRYKQNREEHPEYFDRYLGKEYRALSILTADDLNHADTTEQK